MRPLYALIVFVLLLSPTALLAQGDGPGAHRLSPTGVWAINPKFLNLDQNLLPAGNILVQGADLNIDVYPITLVHTFRIRKNFARVFAVVIPGSLDATLDSQALPTSGQSQQVSLSANGFSDGYLALEVGIIGAPALNALEFAQHQPAFSLMGIMKYWYSGSYDSSKLINMGTNRSTFELGATMAIPLHKTLEQKATWLEVKPTVQLFTNNNDPARGNSAMQVTQDPLYYLEGHLVHNFTKNFWASLDTGYQLGGETSADGIPDNNGLHTWAGGVSAGYQVAAPVSIYASYGGILSGDNGARSRMLRFSLVFAYVNLKKLKEK